MKIQYLAFIPLLWISGCFSGGGEVAKEYQPTQPITQWSNADWQKVLYVVCTDDGLVRYDALEANKDGCRDALFRYVGQINKVSPETNPALFPTGGEVLAYYINAYNALCMYGLVQKGLPGNVYFSGIFLGPDFPVGGKKINLDKLEKQYVRTAGDPRVHFALNCMSASCPPLRKEAYEGAKLDEQMADQGRRFMSDPRGVQLDSDGKAKLNEIFTKFYPAEFKEHYARQTGRTDPDLLESIRQFAGPDSPVHKASGYKSMAYDWSLNRAK